jgi:hypothetical protein
VYCDAKEDVAVEARQLIDIGEPVEELENGVCCPEVVEDRWTWSIVVCC